MEQIPQFVNNPRAPHYMFIDREVLRNHMRRLTEEDRKIQRELNWIIRCPHPMTRLQWEQCEVLEAIQQQIEDERSAIYPVLYAGGNTNSLSCNDVHFKALHQMVENSPAGWRMCGILCIRCCLHGVALDDGMYFYF